MTPMQTMYDAKSIRVQKHPLIIENLFLYIFHFNHDDIAAEISNT